MNDIEYVGVAKDGFHIYRIDRERAKSLNTDYGINWTFTSGGYMYGDSQYKI